MIIVLKHTNRYRHQIGLVLNILQALTVTADFEHISQILATFEDCMEKNVQLY